MTRRRPARVAVAVLAAALVAASCVGSDRADPARRDAPDTGTLRWAPCDGDPEADCADLEVPLDWAEPRGPTIRLAVARLSATGDRLGALVTNPGGPGASGLDYLFSRPFGRALAERFDLVSWDPRGVGESTLVTCGDMVPEFLAQDPSPDDPAELAGLTAAAAAVSTECGEEDGGLLPHMGSDDMARDLEAVRVALGEERLDYFGFSYGTLIGQRYLDLFGDRVRSMVLDGVVDPAEGLTGLLVGQVEAMDAALERAWAACEEAPDCPVEDPSATFEHLRRRVEDRPLEAERPVGPAELSFANVYASYDPSLWDDLMEAYAAATGGDGAPLWELASAYYDLGGWTAYAATMCVDSAHPATAEDWERFVAGLTLRSEWAGPAIGNELLPCATWPVPAEPVNRPVVAPGSPPVLLVGTTGDAATPIDDARRVADTLARATLVTLRSEGHTASGRSDCVDEVVHDYLIDGDVPPADVTCDLGGG